MHKNKSLSILSTHYIILDKGLYSRNDSHHSDQNIKSEQDQRGMCSKCAKLISMSECMVSTVKVVCVCVRVISNA